MAPPPPPPPPVRNSNNSSVSASDLADEFDNIQYFPTVGGSSPTSSNGNIFKPRQGKKSCETVSLMSSSSSASCASSMSISCSSTNSNLNFSFSDDFTLGSRSSNIPATSTNQVTKTHGHHHHPHNHRRPSNPYNNYRSVNSKERYVFSNFRFLVKDSVPFPDSVDEPFDWLSIEMVLVPEIENVLCPICLDVPCIPRFTPCGHIYCLPCLLQYFQTSEASSEGLGNNWRTCPVCAEPLHFKQLRPVKFCPATEPNEGEYFNSVLIEKPVNSLRPSLPKYSNDSLSNLSPFQRLIPISKSFVLKEILTPEINILRVEIKNRKLFGEETLELSFFEAAIKLLEDQKKNLISEESEGIKNSKPPSQTQRQDFYYFHQSRDGLNIFLHPLCMKILKYHFNSYTSIPTHLSLPIIQLERVLVNSSNRKRFKYLDHLSLGTQIILVEVDLRSIVSPSTLEIHSKELSTRKDVRDQQKVFQSTLSSKTSGTSILDEWKRMEDDYYSLSQISAAMDIKVPESVKLDNLDDEASFPLPSSFNGSSTLTSTPVIPIKINNIKKTPPIGTSVGSPSFSALAHSLNSPFTFSSSVNFNNEPSLIPTTNTPPSNCLSWGILTSTETSPNLSTSTTTTTTSTGSGTNTNSTNGKKKIVLFSSGLNVKQR